MPSRVGSLDFPERYAKRSVAVYHNTSLGYYIKPEGLHEKLHGATRWTTLDGGTRMRGQTVYTEAAPRAAGAAHGEVDDVSMPDGGISDEEEHRQLQLAIAASLEDVVDGNMAMPARDVVQGPAGDAAPLPAAAGEDAAAGVRACAICLTEPAVILMRPCNHVCACLECSRRLGGRPCIICRRYVRTTERIYW